MCHFQNGDNVSDDEGASIGGGDNKRNGSNGKGGIESDDKGSGKGSNKGIQQSQQ